MGIIEKNHRLSPEHYVGRISVAFTLCLKDRATVFTSAAVVDLFVSMLKDRASQYEILIPVYCFMPDHQHLIMKGDNDSVNVLQTLRSYKQKTGFWLSKNTPGVRWQKDYYDHIIRNEDKLSTHIKYILANPVRKGLVTDWREYPFKGAIGCELDEW